jgi:flagellar biosynthesis chaperone FliJ
MTSSSNGPDVVDLTLFDLPDGLMHEKKDQLLKQAKEGKLYKAGDYNTIRVLGKFLGCRTSQSKTTICLDIYQMLGVNIETTDAYQMKKRRESKKQDGAAAAAAAAAVETPLTADGPTPVVAPLSDVSTPQGDTMEEMKKLVTVYMECKGKEKQISSEIKSKKRTLHDLSESLCGCFDSGKPVPTPEQLNTQVGKIQQLNEQVSTLETEHDQIRKRVACMSEYIQPVLLNPVESICGICLEEYSEINGRMVLTACGHVFCKECTPRLKECAVCRKSKKGAIAVFL